MEQPRYIITIPAKDESGTIGDVINRIKKAMLNYNYRIIVVDDGSKDNTVQIAKDAGAIVFSHPLNYGLAETFRTEMEVGLGLIVESEIVQDGQIVKIKTPYNADYFIHIDADGQYIPEEIPLIIKKLDEAELVLGSRFKGTITGMPIIKRLGNMMFSKVISFIVKQPISDAQTGFRGFTRSVAKQLKFKSDYTYTQEQIIRAYLHKFAIAEVPATFIKRGHGKSRLLSNPFSYAWRAWINLIRLFRDYAPLKLFGSVGIFLLSIGVGLSFYILYILWSTGQIGRYPLVMITVFLLLAGIQMIAFGFMADQGNGVV